MCQDIDTVAENLTEFLNLQSDKADKLASQLSMATNVRTKMPPLLFSLVVNQHLTRDIGLALTSVAVSH